MTNHRFTGICWLGAATSCWLRRVFCLKMKLFVTVAAFDSFSCGWHVQVWDSQLPSDLAFVVLSDRVEGWTVAASLWAVFALTGLSITMSGCYDDQQTGYVTTCLSRVDWGLVTEPVYTRKHNTKMWTMLMSSSVFLFEGTLWTTGLDAGGEISK